jgi:hypothetical protein
MVPISRDAALAKAESFASWVQLPQRLYAHLMSDADWETNVVGDQIRSQTLVIVLPNGMNGAFFGNRAKVGYLSARLVWEIWFRPIHAKPPTGDVYDDDFAIWIDAYTGERIGGDAML